MRVRIKYYNNNCGSPCGTTNYGEVEDYTVIVNDPLYSWLTVSPFTGTVPAQETMPVTVTFDSEGLEEGDYFANIKINSNDPDEPVVVVPCTLKVANHIYFDIKVAMEGPWSGLEMQTSLNGSGLLPLYQPFSAAPWNYSGTENVVAIPNANVVDWVLVELRDALTAEDANSGTSIARQAGFVLKDGSIRGTDGSSLIQFSTGALTGKNMINQQLFVAIHHRNHLGVLSNNALSSSGGVYSYNFTSPEGQAHGFDAQKLMVSGVWGMISGDSNADGMIENNDFNPLWSEFAGEEDYSPFDLNLDGQINNVDKDSYWVPNLGKGSYIPE